MESNFFNESKEQSQVKAAIVSKYFVAWARIISRQRHVDRIMYLDLFAGPGRYGDGTVSTPLLVLEKTLADPVLCRQLTAIFNDKDTNNTLSLQNAIKALPGINQLKNAPRVWNKEVGTEMVKLFGEANLAPTLFFVDPWGYKGLSLGLVNAVVKDWACECIFFFNYNRINMGLTNPVVLEHMNALFGADLADDLREKLPRNSAADRELLIVESLCKALNPTGSRYILPFTFKNEKGSRTSHHLIFVSKSELGYSIMKEIMAGESSNHVQGVASFAYNIADKRYPVLFEYGRPLEDLQEMLLEKFAGRQLTVGDIFHNHHVGKPYVLKNYKAAITALDDGGLVTTTRTESNRRLKQCPEKVQVNFGR